MHPEPETRNPKLSKVALRAVRLLRVGGRMVYSPWANPTACGPGVG